MTPANNKTLLRSYSYVRKYYLKELFILLLILCQNAGALSFPYFIKVIIDKVFPAADFQMLIEVLLFIVGIQLFSMVAGILSAYFQQQVSNAVMEDLRTDLFDHIIHLPIDFYNKNDIGEVIHSLSNEVNIIREFLTTSLIQFANNLILIIGISLILYFLDAKLFFLCILLIPLLLITISLFHRRIRAYIARDRKADASVMSFMIEKLDNVILIKLFNRYRFEWQNFRNRIREYIKINLRVTMLRAQGTQISIFLIAMAPVVVIGFGSGGIFSGILSLGTLVAFLEYFNLMIGPSRNMLGLYYGMLRAGESARKLMAFFDTPIPDRDRKPGAGIEPVERIAVEQVGLTLGANQILEEVSFVLEKGRSYGFVGASGSGKSSLTFMLCGLYKADKGHIYFNGKDTKDLGVYALCDQVGLVRSNTKLLRGTIRDNILYGIESAGADAVEAVLEFVGLADYILELPQQLDTDISDLGTRLSDGQRQRLAIARALLKDPQVLILDEATSAMDSISESTLIRNILDRYQDRIVVVISHRLSTVSNLDEIICLRDGVIAEQDAHARLLAKKGAYWNLFEQQLVGNTADLQGNLMIDNKK